MILEKMLKKRVKRIRRELDLYIKLQLPDVFFEKKADRVSKRFKDSFMRGIPGRNKAHVGWYDNATEEVEELYSVREVVISPNELHEPSRMACAPQMHPAGGFVQTHHLPEIDKALEKKEETFSNMLLRLIDEKGLKDSDVYKRANIDRRLFSKIRGDEEYMPSKKTAIAFCIALSLSVKEANELLETAGYTLSASTRFDLIIMYLMEHKEYNIHFVNMVLDDYGEGTLSK